jgi:hypothetical protein
MYGGTVVMPLCPEEQKACGSVIQQNFVQFVPKDTVFSCAGIKSDNEIQIIAII